MVPDPAASRDLALRLKALSDPTRLQLLELVAAHPGGRACICDLTEPLGVTQPTVSHHMKLLAEAGFVTREQRGKWAYYTIQPQALADVGRHVAGLGGV
nr:metalloregulator ArsR/SmtB family transcription factor [Brooklawnia cerclae]